MRRRGEQRRPLKGAHLPGSRGILFHSNRCPPYFPVRAGGFPLGGGTGGGLFGQSQTPQAGVLGGGLGAAGSTSVGGLFGRQGMELIGSGVGMVYLICVSLSCLSPLSLLLSSLQGACLEQELPLEGGSVVVGPDSLARPPYLRELEGEYSVPGVGVY